MRIARPHSLYRVICDLKGKEISTGCTPAKAARVEGGPPVELADVNQTYDNLGAAYNFFAKYLNRDSVDGKGMPLKALVEACDGLNCPVKSSFWANDYFVVAADAAAGDDITTHELTHGITDYTSNLAYTFQSGAINESMSDIFGEFEDQVTAVPGSNDQPHNDWLFGEDEAQYQPVRSLADPTRAMGRNGYRSPDRMHSPYYFVSAADINPGSPDDSGGVHYNSGVGNKAAWLIAAPGTHVFNGQRVTGIGIPKAARIYYRVLQTLPSAANYPDLATALTTTCAHLSATRTAGITATDCLQVQRAVTATEMRLPPLSPAAALVPPAPVCPTGTSATVLAADGFEHADTGPWTVTGQWRYPPAQGTDPAYSDIQYHSYAREGKRSLESYTPTDLIDPALPRRSIATWKTTLAVPAGTTTYLRFQQARLMSVDKGKNLGAGYVQYRLDGGQWQDAGKLFTDNGYTGALAKSTGYGTTKGFTGSTHGYTASRMNLTPLAGHQVQIRFVSVIDKEYVSAWWLDDVRAYTCAPADQVFVARPSRPTLQAG
ncbi:M4 family metallopeptidase [Sphaerisporangium corydalis]|uniref:Neutral metalloproteinase n=1 Tax=Sphaerisporangium corydalis TaxID=1441875 RepID=A0ABV9EWT0_9ACTN|nr:M4 family metallopeptidase [Sphaerisporangium corydalis]